MVMNNLTPNFTAKIPYISTITGKLSAFPYVQTAIEQKFVDGTISDPLAPVSINAAIKILKNFFPDTDFSSFNGNNDLLTREKFILILKKNPNIEKEVKNYEKNLVKKERNIVGSAVSDFVLGNTKSLDKIELSSYYNRNRFFIDMFWEVATKKDTEYQQLYEDLSNESLDLLTKRLNKALLYFYESQYWLAIEECNLILKEDPTHTGALSLKGSIYYMLQDYERAKKYWKRVLHYQPNNQEIIYFLQTLED